MSRTNQTIRLSAKTFLFSIGLTLVACGGGDSPSNTIPAATVSYDGKTTEATVDTTSAIELTKAYITANQENVGGLLALAGGATITSTQQPLDSDAKNLLIEQLKQQVLNSLNNKSSIVTGAGLVYKGNCVDNSVPDITDNGSVTATVFTQNNSETTAKFSYKNLCLYNIIGTEEIYTVINGDVYSTTKGTNLQNIDFIIDSMVLNIPKLTVYFKNITTGDSFTETISEYISFVFEHYVSGYPTKTTMYIYSDIDVAGTVYRFEVVSIIDFSGTGTGTWVNFYHPTYGSITYEDNLIYGGACGDAIPDGGSFVITTATTTVKTEYTVTPAYDPIAKTGCGLYNVNVVETTIP